MTSKRIDYTKTSKFLHWLIAILALLMLSMGFFLDDLPETLQDSAFMIHKSIGLTILMLMIFRILWIVLMGKPALSKNLSSWEKGLAHLVHFSLYLGFLAMPLSGWLMSVAKNHVPVFFGLFNLPFPGIKPNEILGETMEWAHKNLAWFLIALIVLHIIGALKHYFIDKDQTMQRML